MKIEIDKLTLNREVSKYFNLIPGFIHNLNTPLMSISGRVELIQFRNPDVQGLDQIISQLDKINEMMEVMRYILEKDKSTEQEVIYLTDFFAKFDKFLTLNMTYKHKISAEMEIEPESKIEILPFIFINTVYEIFKHCIDYMPNGGIVKLNVFSENDKLLVIITRDGINISTNELSCINDNDIQKEQYDSDADLVIVKKLANLANGFFTVENNEQENFSSYKLVFPLKAY